MPNRKGKGDGNAIIQSRSVKAGSYLEVNSNCNCKAMKDDFVNQFINKSNEDDQSDINDCIYYLPKVVFLYVFSTLIFNLYILFLMLRYAIFCILIALSLSYYTNPVQGTHDSPDPGVLYHDGAYYAVTTSGWDGHAFPIWKSVKGTNF